VLATGLSLLAAVGYGTSDFVAGLWSRRIGFVWVSLIAEATATATILVALAVIGPGRPPPAALAWGAAAGLGSGVGTLALYRGFARGQIAVVAPLSALGAAALPVLAGLATGERPPPLALAGISLALPAAWLVSRPQASAGPAGRSPGGVADGLVAGAGFALLFIGLKKAGHAGGLWPVFTDQATGLAVLLVVLALPFRPAGHGRCTRSGAAGAAGAGALGAAATVSYFDASQRGLLTVAALLTSLYPAMTLVLARVILREHIGRLRGLGLALAGVAIALIAG
jgi:drug/metabolite transporter (DMT)-like permease